MTVGERGVSESMSGLVLEDRMNPGWQQGMWLVVEDKFEAYIHFNRNQIGVDVSDY